MAEQKEAALGLICSPTIKISMFSIEQIAYAHPLIDDCWEEKRECIEGTSA